MSSATLKLSATVQIRFCRNLLILLGEKLFFNVTINISFDLKKIISLYTRKDENQVREGTLDFKLNGYPKFIDQKTLNFALIQTFQPII